MGRAERRARKAVLLAAAISIGGCTVTNSAVTNSAVTSSTVSPGTGSPPAETDPAARPPDAACPPATGGPAEAAAEAQTVELKVVGEFPGGSVLAAEYPLADDLGNPWSQWGQGVVLPDGRFVSAVGDHRGADGRSWFYEYDPGTRTLSRSTEVSGALGHRAGDWGYGKIHAPMLLDVCDRVVTSTYWGTRRGLEYGGSYTGDHLIRYDPSTRDVESLGVPAPGHGLPSLAISPDRRTIYAEAVDPESEPDGGQFVVIDALSGEVLEVSESPDHQGFRDILITADAAALHAAGADQLAGLDAGGSSISETAPFGGGWLRAVTEPLPDGDVVIATRRPEILVRRGADGTYADLGGLEGYVAALAMSPDGSTAYYVPGAHGDGWTFGTPIIAVDVQSGQRSELVRLNDLIEPALGLRAGGTYNIVVAPDGRRIYIGLNSGSPDEERPFGQVVLAVVEFDEPLAVPDTARSPTATGAGPPATCWAAPPAAGTDLSFADATADFGLLEPLTGMHPHAAAATDVNADGWTDIFVGTFADRPSENYAVRGAEGPSPDRLLLGGPDGFEIDPTFPGQLARTSGAVFADLDGDGDEDLVAARNPKGASGVAGNPTTVFENTDGGWTARATLGLEIRGRAVVALDIDGDGTLDLVLLGDQRGSATSAVYRGDGEFGFTDASADWGFPTDLTGLAMAAADLDGDGWRDLAVNGDSRVLRGGPDGFTVESVPELTWDLYGDEDDPAGVAVGDLDGDGRPDLVLGQHFNSTLDDGRRVPVRILLNRSTPGDVTFTDVTDESGSPPLATKSPHVAVVDVDNDGRNDVVTSAATTSGTPLVLRNAGTSNDGVPRFEMIGDAGDGEYYVTGVEADFDHDGRVDNLLLAWEPERASRMSQNRSASGRWLEVDLSDLDDRVGAQVRLVDPESDEVLGRTWVQGTTGYAAGAAPVVHFGLGSTAPDEVVIEVSPVGGATVRSRVGVDRRIALVGCPD